MGENNLAAPCGIFCGACRQYLLKKKDLLEKRGYKQGCDVKFISYIFQKSFSRFNLTPHGVVMDLKNNGTLFVKINEKIGHPLKITNNPDGYIEPLMPVIDNLNAYAPNKP